MFGPWFFNLLISLFFTSLSVACLIRTNFASILFYDVSISFVMLLSIAFMLTFMWQMRRNLPKLSDPIVIPHPTFICSLVLTISVTIGYCYIFIYKLALYGCDRAVEAQDPIHMTVDSLLRLTIALFAFVSFIYIIQRAHVGTLKTKFDFLTRNIINCVFGIVWLRFILLKALFTIEQFCRDQIEMSSVIKDFCPPYIKNGFHCNTTELRKEQQVWYRLHYGLLKSTVVTCASELIPVLLVGHWIACGHAKVIMRKLTMKVNVRKNAIQTFKKLSGFKGFSSSSLNAIKKALHRKGSDDLDSGPMLIHTERVQTALKSLAIIISVCGILLWQLSFYNYVSDLEESGLVFFQDGIEVITSLIQLGFFILLFLCTCQISSAGLDLHRRAESRADRVLIFGSVLFLSMECVCEILELLFFSVNKRARIVIKVMDIFYSICSLSSNWLEALCLRKVIALSDAQHRQLRNILPFVSICCILFNLSDFAMTYFYIETQKHHLKEVIVSLTNSESNELFVLIGVAGRLLDTANYLYTFTCALCWIDVLIRFKGKLFIIGKKSSCYMDSQI